MKMPYVLTLITSALIGGIILVVYISNSKPLSFEECSAKYGATKSYPGACTTPQGKVIIQQVD